MFPYLNPEAQAVLQSGMDAADTMLLGRRTYQEFAAYWPTASEDPIAPYMNTTPKIVVSTTLHDLPWGPAKVIARDVASELARLKRQPGKNLGIVGLND